MFTRSLDAAATTDTDRRHENTKCYTLIDGSGVVAMDADFVSMDADGFTLNWTTEDNTARIVNYIPTVRSADTDQLTLNIFSVRGERYILDCTVRIAERRAECKQRK